RCGPVATPALVAPRLDSPSAVSPPTASLHLLTSLSGYRKKPQGGSISRVPEMSKLYIDQSPLEGTTRSSSASNPSRARRAAAPSHRRAFSPLLNRAARRLVSSANMEPPSSLWNFSPVRGPWRQGRDPCDQLLWARTSGRAEGSNSVQRPGGLY